MKAILHLLTFNVPSSLPDKERRKKKKKKKLVTTSVEILEHKIEKEIKITKPSKLVRINL